MSPPARIILPCEPIPAEQVEKWTRQLKAASVFNGDIYRLVQPILGFRISPGSHRKFLVPAEEIARLMGVSVKTANRFIKPARKFGNKRMTPAASRAVWAASFVAQYFRDISLDRDHMVAWLYDEKMVRDFLALAEKFADWFGRNLGQLELPGFGAVASVEAVAAPLPEENRPRGRQKLRIYHLDVLLLFESWQELDAEVPKFFKLLTDEQVEMKLIEIDKEKLKRLTTDGGEVYFDFKEFPPAPFVFAPICVAKARGALAAASRIRKRLLAMTEFERFWATSRLQDLERSGAIRVEKEGKWLTPGWIRSDRGSLSVQLHPKMSPDPCCTNLAVEYFSNSRFF